jgi:hypothetical protein
MNTFFEGDLERRIERAKELAQRIVSNDTHGFEESMLAWRFILARHYNLPLFHEYFLERTIDELILEVELLNAVSQSGEQHGSKLLSENKEEAEALFDDWIEEDMKAPPMSEPEWEATSKQFMETGKFKGET